MLKASQISVSPRSRDTLIFALIAGLMFILNPFFTVLLTGFTLMLRQSLALKPGMKQLWFILMALWLGMLNITKVPEGDQEMYVWMFERAAKLNPLEGIFNYAGGVEKEPVYGLYNYLCYWLFGGSKHIFFMLSTFIQYYLLFSAVNRVFTRARQGVSAVVCGVMVLSFFPQVFTLSIHLMRQSMAFAIVLYAVSLKTEDGRDHWVPLICAMFIHSAAALFVLLSLIPWIYHRMTPGQWAMMIAGLGAVVLGCNAIGSTMVELLGEDSNSSYIFRRMSSSFTDGLELKTDKYLMVAIPLFLVVINLLARHLNGSTKPDRLHSTGYYSPLYPYLYLFLFVTAMVLSFFTMPLIQYRFSFVDYTMAGFILPLFFRPANSLRLLYQIMVSLAFIALFLATFKHSGWTYRIEEIEILTCPLPTYFINSPL